MINSNSVKTLIKFSLSFIVCSISMYQLHLIKDDNNLNYAICIMVGLIWALMFLLIDFVKVGRSLRANLGVTPVFNTSETFDELQSKIDEMVSAQPPFDIQKEAPNIIKYNIVGASVAGKGHRNENGEITVPCQDAHNYYSKDGWHVIVVCDGAGSYENSQLGSAYCSEQLPYILESKIECKGTVNSYSIFSGTAEEWRTIAIEIFNELKTGLQELALEKKIDFHSLGCTVNFTFFTESHILSAHIGDGRAAYKKADGVWEALITPFKGDEPGCTVFITSDYTWANPHECIETNVIIESNPIEAVVLLSDGMESYSFLCYTKKENVEMYYDPNEPFAPFLDGNIGILKNMVENNHPDIDKAWQSYLETGKKLKDEYDDKTLLIAFKS